MPTIQLLQSVKHSDNKGVFIVQFSEGIEIIFSLLPIKQALQISKILSITESLSSQYYIYKYIFNECVTDSCLAKVNESLPAGVVPSIAQTILYLSGVFEDSFDYTEQLLEVYRENINNSLSVIKRTICQVFNGYTFQALDRLNYQELIEVFTNAEQILLDRGIIEGRISFSRVGEEEPRESISEMIQRDQKEYQDFEIDQIKQKLDIDKIRELQRQRVRQLQGG